MTELCYKLKSNGTFCRNYQTKNKSVCYVHNTKNNSQDNSDDTDNIDNTDNTNYLFNYKILTIISMLLTCLFIYQIEYYNLIENELNDNCIYIDNWSWTDNCDDKWDDNWVVNWVGNWDGNWDGNVWNRLMDFNIINFN